ncbi:hypothetical protein M422DRAFT_225076 [Sphaerobolus stellatus SS14]|nr:hypothetical protein M422DRAFT_225076 [Sphaerobolus stellatus SS14]
MVLPPKSKDFRRRAHLLADAFNLKSKSQGKGESRFTTFLKSTRSGIQIDERKISMLVRGHSGEGFRMHGQSAKVKPAKPVRARQKDGDVVGHAAPKLSDTNIGFKLLQQMGWAEGDRIGATGGLADPLTAVIKTTKLGLGATRGNT